MKINEKNLSAFAAKPPVDLEGWLNKKGEINKNYQRRWFVLKANLLFYFERKGDRDPLGVVILEGCTIGMTIRYSFFQYKNVFYYFQSLLKTMINSIAFK